MQKIMKIMMTLLVAVLLFGQSAEAMTQREAAELAAPYEKVYLEPVAVEFGQTAEETAQIISQLPYEVIAFFDYDTGEKLGAYTCFSSKRVNAPKDFLQELQEYDGRLMEMHNHPSKNCSFSPADIESAAARKIQCAVVVGRWNTFSLELKKGAKWKSVKTVSKIARSNNMLGVVRAKKLLKKNKIQQDKYYFTATNWAVKETAKRLKLRYKVTPHGEDGTVQLPKTFK